MFGIDNIVSSMGNFKISILEHSENKIFFVI